MKGSVAYKIWDAEEAIYKALVCDYISYDSRFATKFLRYRYHQGTVGEDKK